MWLSEQPLGRSRSAQRRISRAPGGQDCASNCGATSRCGCLSCSRSRGRESGTATAAAAAAETETGPCPARRRSGVGAAHSERARTLETAGPEIPKSKSQAPTKFQSANLRISTACPFLLEIEVLVFLGVWNLGFGSLARMAFQ